MQAMLGIAVLIGLICGACVLVPVESKVELDMSQAFASSLLAQAPSTAAPADCVSHLLPNNLCKPQSITYKMSLLISPCSQ